MAGLFLNFFYVSLSGDTFDISNVAASDYQSKEDYFALRDTYPDFHFYRQNERIYYWSKSGENKVLPLNSTKSEVTLNSHPKIISKIMESCLIHNLQENDKLNVHSKRYSFSNDILSTNNILLDIDGLAAKNCYNISPKFFNKNGKIILGFTISLRTKYEFTYNRKTLESKGFDTSGLKGDEDEIYANSPAVKRYVESMGKALIYERFKKHQTNTATNYVGIQTFLKWLNERIIPGIKLPSNNQMLSLKSYNLPSTDFNYQTLRRPKRYFYSGIEDTKGIKYYNQKVQEYKPASYDEIDNDVLIGVICPKKYEGRTETFLKTLKSKLESELHVRNITYALKFIENENLDSYSSVLYDDDVQEAHLVIVIVSEDQKIIPVKTSPYYVCKAKLIGNGVPTQLLTIETINAGVKSFAMTNLTLNAYAKIGGTAWTIEKEDKLKKEFIIGIGSTTLKDGKHVLGLAQIFDPDGRYLVGDCAPISTFENYKGNLKEFLYRIIEDEIESASLSGSDEFRLIFHIYKSPSSEYELAAVKEVIENFQKYTFKYALIHLAYGHNYRLFYGQGQNDVSRGVYLPLDNGEALLNFVQKSNLPLKIKLDRRSTFKDLQYLSQQVYWFSELSHRSYMPAKRTVTLTYPSLMVALTEKLKEVDGWDFDRLKHINDKLWFI
ncbi:Piwi domain-containing protein [Maribacter dokdonensis]|uniref:Protein argonaute n=1 Tax=Maribacter dokdonensis TaxID=320912 RepID=A0A1H4M537_9FLAO|nr:hypothetical protein [Maribacter dokdonensis]SEB78190.1 Piwi domain-containing protein [Maribacter dokdonensis]